ncbi:MAG TPA: polymer-forming cytoskeletal protein [Polyangiaceae bacterium]|nr:polymer-forming cytoskeletal protein [Polyangiaceae bacterium]
MAEGSVIGQSTVVRGNVRGEGSLEIFGRVDGDVSVTGDVTLGENASVRGDVNGARLTIGGTVTGDLRGTEAVVLERTAQVTGDIIAPRLGIEEGALVRGGIRMDAPTGSGRAQSDRRPAPRAEAPRPAARPAAPPPSAPAQKKQPPAPVVPAFRGLTAKKKKVRGR